MNGDERLLRLIGKWLKAGVLEEGKLTTPDRGTPQGAVISPVLANVYLHYVLDLWTHRWRQRRARGAVIVVRYADDVVLGFQHLDEAQRFLADLKERLGAFALEPHPDKTRIIEFGRYAVSNRTAGLVGRRPSLSSASPTSAGVIGEGGSSPTTHDPGTVEGEAPRAEGNPVPHAASADRPAGPSSGARCERPSELNRRSDQQTGDQLFLPLPARLRHPLPDVRFFGVSIQGGSPVR